MSAMWNRTLVYLGLREEPDEVYDGLPARFVPEDDPYAEHAPPRGAAGRREVLVDRAAAEPAFAVSGASDGRGDTLTAAPASGGAGRRAGWSPPLEPVEDNVRPLRVAEPGTDAAEHRAVVRVAQVDITDFDDVEAVGARYRTGQAVLFDLSATSSATARRVVDFVSGLTYALRGRLTKVGSRAFLLVPDGMRISPDERRRLTELGYRVPASGSTA